MRLLWALAAVAFLLGCPARTSGGRAPASAVCERIGTQCALPDGPLGVCAPTTTGPCDREPCLQCMPQH